MSGHGEKLSRAKQTAIAALLTNPSIAAAASAAGIAERTIYRWLKIHGFQQAYAAARQECVKQALATIQQAMSTAVDVLSEVMSDPKAPASARISAARTVIDNGIKVSEIEKIEQRLSALERRLK